MRVAISALWRTTTPSGICRHAAALACCLCLHADVERVYLLVGSWQMQYFERALQLNHRKLIIRPLEIANHAYARNMWYLYGLPKIADKVGLHLVHLSFPVPLNRKLLTIPVVTTLHDLYPYDAPANFGYPRVFGHRLVLRQCLQRSDRIACVSDFTLSRLAAIFGTETAGKAVRIYNCVELSDIRQLRPRALNLNGRPFLLCVAQHRKNKNIELALEGFMALRARDSVNKDTVLVIVGSPGPETATIERTITKLGLQAHVILAHGLLDAELAWLYKNTLLTVCTSTTEGFGLPVAEAIHYGARIACSDIPALREIGRDNCAFFSLSGVDPVQNFVQACERSLWQAPSSMEPNPLFSAETIAAQYMHLYSHLLRSRVAKAA